jgi:hypothetical protein
VALYVTTRLDDSLVGNVYAKAVVDALPVNDTVSVVLVIVMSLLNDYYQSGDDYN